MKRQRTRSDAPRFVHSGRIAAQEQQLAQQAWQQPSSSTAPRLCGGDGLGAQFAPRAAWPGAQSASPAAARRGRQGDVLLARSRRQQQSRNHGQARRCPAWRRRWSARPAIEERRHAAAAAPRAGACAAATPWAGALQWQRVLVLMGRSPQRQGAHRLEEVGTCFSSCATAGVPAPSMSGCTY